MSTNYVSFEILSALWHLSQIIFQIPSIFSSSSSLLRRILGGPVCQIKQLCLFVQGTHAWCWDDLADDPCFPVIHCDSLPSSNILFTYFSQGYFHVSFKSLSYIRKCYKTNLWSLKPWRFIFAGLKPSTSLAHYCKKPSCNPVDFMGSGSQLSTKAENGHLCHDFLAFFAYWKLFFEELSLSWMSTCWLCHLRYRTSLL